MPSWGRVWDITRDVMIDHELYMDVYEFKVLFFVYKRTCMFNKEWETIPLRHFSDGVMARDGALVAASTGLSEPKLLESLRHLERKGIIEVRRDIPLPSQYRIRNEDELDLPSIISYIRRHQPKLYGNATKHLNRLRTRQGMRVPHSPINRGMTPQNIGEPTPQNIGEHNIPITKKPILKVPPLAVKRSIKLRK